MDLLKKIFILTLFFFPLGELVRINLSNGLAVKPLDVGVGLVVILWAVFKFIKKEKVKQVHIFIPIILFALSGFFSLITSSLHLSAQEFLVSFSYLLRWTAYAGIFFVVSDFDKNFKKKISKLLIIVGSLVVGFGYLQYFFYSSLKNLFYLGWDEHMYRMFSVFLDPNFAGVFFVLFFLFLINFFLEKKSVLIGLFSILTLGAVFLTFSRSALIMLIVSSSLFFILKNRKKWIVLLFGIILLVIVVSSKYFNIENINLFRIVSSEARIKTAEKAIEIIKRNPILGVGFNAYRYAKLDQVSRTDSSKLVSHADAGVDNSFLFVIATTGMIGFLIYAYLWLKIVENQKNNALSVACIAGVFVSSLFINSLFYAHIMFWLWIIIGLRENT